MGEEFLKGLFEEAYTIGNDAEFSVHINSDEGTESSIMSYIELGTFLITNTSRIESVDIKLKEV